MSQPSFTVVIPTRERADVLLHCVQSIRKIVYPALTILIVDNFSQDNTREVVESIDDPRISYVNSGRRLSMTHNWEFALGNVSSDWVTIIGDDDSLMQDSLERVVEIADTLGVEAVRGGFANYYWPGTDFSEYGRLTVPMGQKVQLRNSAIWISKVMEGRASYYDLPCLYTGGFVRMTVLDKIKRLSGSYLLSRIPDIYSGFAIGNSVEQFGHTSHPLGIAGRSKHSTGHSHLLLSRTQNGDDAESTISARRFNSEGEPIPYHASIPLTSKSDIPSAGQAFSLESYFQASVLKSSANEIDLQKQLAIILSQLPKAQSEEWGQAFAQSHNLSLKKATKASRRIWLVNNTLRIGKLFRSMFTTVRIGNSKNSIEDVSQASAVAYQIALKPPNPLRNFTASALVLVRMLWTRVVGKPAVK